MMSEAECNDMDALRDRNEEQAEYIATLELQVVKLRNACTEALADYERLNEAAKMCGLHPFTITPNTLRTALAESEAKP